MYNIALFLLLLLLSPKLFLDRLKGKRHPSFLKRLGFFWPRIHGQTVIWFHAVSVGEVKAAAPLFRQIQTLFPKAYFIFTTTTETGHLEAKRSIQADWLTYLPFDFSFVVRRIVRKVAPSFFFLVENDIWPNLLRSIKKQGGVVILVSGKISEKTAHRLRNIPFLSRMLYQSIDLICSQNAEYTQRFISIGASSHIETTGNLKFDIEPEKAKKLPLPEDQNYLTISCTHDTEEEQLLWQLKSSYWTLFLAPRHPERFQEVLHLVKRQGFSFILFSELLGGKDYQGEKVIFVDKMGVLPACYQQSKVAIVGGSFVPHVGGHNLLEPCFYSCPVIFGPYTQNQKEIRTLILQAKAGICSTNILDAIQSMQEDIQGYTTQAKNLSLSLRGSLKVTLQQILPFLEKIR